MMMSVTELILSSSPLATVAPVAVASFNYRRYPASLRLISILLYVAAFVQLVAWIFWLNRLNNLFLLHLYTVVEFILITSAYRLVLDHQVKSRTYGILITAFLLIAVADATLISGIGRYNVISRSSEALIVIVCSILYFIQLLRTMRVQKLENDPFFWLSAAFLLYFSGSLFLFILSNSILYVSVATNRIIWSLHAILAWVMYVVLTIGLWKAKKN